MMTEPDVQGYSPLVLIVDDHQINLVLLCRLVESAGYRVCEAQDGAVALKLLDQMEPDVILLDVFMPTMDGFEVLQAVRNHPTLHYTPVIIITAGSEIHIRQQAYQHGADDFLLKPVDPATLRARLWVATRQKQLVSHINQERERFALMATISRELAHITSLHDTLEYMVNVCTTTLHATQGSLILVRNTSNVVEVLTTNDRVRINMAHMEQVIVRGAAGYVVQHQRSLLIDDIYTSSYWLHLPTSTIQRGSALIVPIDDAAGLLGTLGVFHDQTHYFTPDDQTLLELVAHQVAGLIRQAHLREEQAILTEQLSLQTRQLALVNTLAQTLTSNLDLNTLYKAIDQQMQHLMGDVVIGWYVFGLATTTLAYTTKPMMTSGSVVDSTLHEALQHLVKLDRAEPFELAFAPQIAVVKELIEAGYVGCLAIPLHHQGGVLGVLMLSAADRMFTAEEVLLVEMARPHLAVALANAQAVADQAARSNEQAELRHLRSMSELSGQMAHHFNNLFAAILGNTQLAELDAVNDDQQMLLATIVDQVRDGAAMIKRLHLLKGGDRGTSTLTLDVDDVLPGYLEHLAVTNKTPFTHATIEPNVFFPLRERELFTLSSELLSNAYEAGSEAAQVRMKVYQTSQHMCLSVRDAGCGINPHHMHSDIWRPFWTTHGPQRLGLGLPICAAIMWRVGGTITLAPNIGAPGMTATLLFPKPKGIV